LFAFLLPSALRRAQRSGAWLNADGGELEFRGGFAEYRNLGTARMRGRWHRFPELGPQECKSAAHPRAAGRAEALLPDRASGVGVQRHHRKDEPPWAARDYFIRFQTTSLWLPADPPNVNLISSPL
jgi:hypothetical protein